jgi:hemerythrin
MNLVWSDNYNIGVEEIDAQHRRFLSLMEKLYQSKDDALDKSILKELVRYAEFHFSSEEKMMQIYNYDKIQDHQELHEKLMTELLSYSNPIGSEELDKFKLLKFLIKWFLDHTTREDKDFGRFIQLIREDINS